MRCGLYVRPVLALQRRSGPGARRSLGHGPGAREAHRERPRPTATTPAPANLDEVDAGHAQRAAHPFGWAPAVWHGGLGAPWVVGRWPGGPCPCGRCLWRWRLLILRCWLLWR